MTLLLGKGQRTCCTCQIPWGARPGAHVGSATQLKRGGTNGGDKRCAFASAGRRWRTTQGGHRLAGRRRRRCNIKRVQFYLFIFNSALQSRARITQKLAETAINLVYGRGNNKDRWCVLSQGGSKQGRKKASPAENEWWMSSLEKGKKKRWAEWVNP